MGSKFKANFFAIDNELLEASFCQVMDVEEIWGLDGGKGGAVVDSRQCGWGWGGCVLEEFFALNLAGQAGVLGWEGAFYFEDWMGLFRGLRTSKADLLETHPMGEGVLYSFLSQKQGGWGLWGRFSSSATLVLGLVRLFILAASFTS